MNRVRQYPFPCLFERLVNGIIEFIPSFMRRKQVRS